MKEDPAIRTIIGDMEHLAAEMMSGKISVLRGTHIEAQLTTLLIAAARTVRDQQYQIIELEEANTKLTKRNANQAALIDAINQGRAKKVAGGGWTHDNIPHTEVTSP